MASLQSQGGIRARKRLKGAVQGVLVALRGLRALRGQRVQVGECSWEQAVRDCV